MTRRWTSAVCGFTLWAAFLTCGSAQAQNTSQSTPDNTAVNKRDRSAQQPTADQAKNNTSDRQLMKEIRRDIVKDKSLSTYGHNVKVIADHGKVTLKGPVHSDDEKKAVEEIAEKYAGQGNVTNDLDVKGDSNPK